VTIFLPFYQIPQDKKTTLFAHPATDFLLKNEHNYVFWWGSKNPTSLSILEILFILIKKLTKRSFY